MSKRPGAAGRMLLFAGALLPLLLAVLPWPPPARAAAPFPPVWFNPAPASADFGELFTRPDLWARVRSQIQVFHFTPEQLNGHSNLAANNLADLVRVDAFRRLRGWGLQTAIGAPAIKGWDCEGKRAMDQTLREIANVTRNGGHVDWVTMDEPLAAGVGLNPRSGCRLGTDKVAAEVAAYVQAVASDPMVLAAGPPPGFVDIEAYPATSVELLQQFVAALQAHGFHPAGLFLDVNIRFVELHPDKQARMAGDLRALQAFLRAQNIPFGVIFWSGRDPIGSDRAYYQRVIDWVTYVHKAIGRPDAAVFSSWVRRCDGAAAGGDFACNKTNLACKPGDRFCGQKSVPLNLPQDDPAAFSHTRLVEEALKILRGP